MVDMNMSGILKAKGISSVETTHFDVCSAVPGSADYFFVGKDLENSVSNLDHVVVLDSIIDKKELAEKLQKVLDDNGITE